jgi:protein gp37
VNIEWPDNAWVGTTVDCQARVKPAEVAFEKIKAKVKFLSCEPLSEEITFTNLTLFDWVIVGARSKTPQLPEMQPESEWVKSLMLQAWDAACKVYCKPNLKAGVKEYPIAEPVA